MRRRATVFALVLLVAPLAARVAAASRAADAACALACARAGMAGDKGAACCPIGHGAAVPTLSTCAHDFEGAPLPAALPVLLCAAPLLTLPALAGRHALAPVAALPFPPALVPDKVPLLG